MLRLRLHSWRRRTSLSKSKPSGLTKKQTCNSKTNRNRCVIQNKNVRQQEQFANIWLLPLMCFSWNTQSAGRGTWWDPTKYPGRVALYFTYWLSPAAAVGIVTCTHVLFEQNPSLIVSDLCCRVQKKHKNNCQVMSDMHSIISVICFWVKSYRTHASVLSRWVGCCEMRTASHTDLPGCNDHLKITRACIWRLILNVI